MVEICKVLLAPALWVALLLLASAATRGEPATRAALSSIPILLTALAPQPHAEARDDLIDDPALCSRSDAQHYLVTERPGARRLVSGG
jgi:hypothetical protein